MVCLLWGIFYTRMHRRMASIVLAAASLICLSPKHGMSLDENNQSHPPGCVCEIFKQIEANNLDAVTGEFHKLKASMNLSE